MDWLMAVIVGMVFALMILAWFVEDQTKDWQRRMSEIDELLGHPNPDCPGIWCVECQRCFLLPAEYCEHVREAMKG